MCMCVSIHTKTQMTLSLPVSSRWIRAFLGAMLFGLGWSAAAEPGSVDPGFDAGGGWEESMQVAAATLRGDGSLLVASRFSDSSGDESSLFRVFEDGRRDRDSFRQTWGRIRGRIHDVVELGGGRVLVGGDFWWRGLGTTRRGLVAVDSEGTPDPTFVPEPGVWQGGVHRLLVLPDGRILAGKALQRFRQVPAVPVLLRLRSDGSMDPTFSARLMATNDVASVESIHPLEDGRLLVGGRFRIEGTSGVSTLVCLRPDGEVDGTFPVSPLLKDAVMVTQILRTPAGLLAAAKFTNRSVLLRLDSDGLLGHDGSVSEFVPRVRRPWTLAALSDGLLVAGSDGVEKIPYDADEAKRLWIPIELGGEVGRLILWPDGDFGVAGSFWNVAGIPRPGLVRFRPDGTLQPNFVRTGPSIGLSSLNLGKGIASVVPLPDGRLLISGGFTHYNGVARPGLARLLPDGGLDLSFSLQLPKGVKMARGVAAAGKQLIVAVGPGTNPGNAPLLRLNPDGSWDRSFRPALSVGAGIQGLLATPQGPVWVSGLNLLPGEVLGRRGIVKVLADGSVDPANQFSENARLLAVHADGRVLIQIGNRLERRLPNGRVDESFEVLAEGSVNAVLALPNGSVVAAGRFPGGQAVLRWGPDGRRDAQFAGPASGLFGNGLAEAGLGRIVVGGNFAGLGTQMLRIHSDGTRDGSFRPTPEIASNGLIAFGSGSLYLRGSRGGFPGSAFAGEILRLDNEAFTLRLAGDGNGRFRLERFAPKGKSNAIEASTDLIHWSAWNAAGLEDGVDAWKLSAPSGAGGLFFRDAVGP